MTYGPTANGDGVLVSDGTTTYAQDLAAPLSQVLTDGTANYVYGHERLRVLGGPWYVGDALGSVRQTLDDAGAVLGSVQYDPWGVPTAGTPQPFGFTGELHSAGQVYLRARWYAPGQGRFVSEDPFAGWSERPYSLHAYQYGYSNPVRWTDPSGLIVGFRCEMLDVCPGTYFFDRRVSDALSIYSKDTWGCFFRSDDGTADDDDIGDLWIDFICEFGERDRVFGATARLTQELAQTKLIANFRAQFYAQGGAPLTSLTSSQMDPGAAMDAKFIDLWRTGQLITITDFLGGLDEWRVTKETSSSGQDVVRFDIYNETTLASGTRFGFTTEGTEEISWIEYRSQPERYNRNGFKGTNIARIDTTRYSLTSLLPAKQERDPTRKIGLGGGTMTQRFIWEEPYDPCYVPDLTRPEWAIPPMTLPPA